MPQSHARKLIFRLGEIGFILDLAWVVEICEQVVDVFDSGRADPEQGIVGALSFRQTQIPVIDPVKHLALPAQRNLAEKTALILRGEEGNWALLVDQVEDIAPAGKFHPCELPPLLKQAVSGYYSQVSLLENEPMIHFEPQHYYGHSVGT